VGEAIYRSWAIPCTGKQVYATRHRAEWLGKIGEPGVRRRPEFYYQQLDALRMVRQEVLRELLEESNRHQTWKRLCQIPSIGPIRAAVLLGILQTRTVSAPRGSYGPTADSALRRTVARITVMSTCSCEERRNRSRFADFIELLRSLNPPPALITTPLARIAHLFVSSQTSWTKNKH